MAPVGDSNDAVSSSTLEVEVAQSEREGTAGLLVKSRRCSVLDLPSPVTLVLMLLFAMLGGLIGGNLGGHLAAQEAAISSSSQPAPLLPLSQPLPSHSLIAPPPPLPPAPLPPIPSPSSPTSPSIGGFALSQYRHMHTWTLDGVQDDLSGVAVLPHVASFGGDQRLPIMLVTNDPTQLLEYMAPSAADRSTQTLELVRTIVLDGFEDTEGLCVLAPSGHGGLVLGGHADLLVTEERRRDIVRVALPAHGVWNAQAPAVNRTTASAVYATQISTYSPNKGIEGVASVDDRTFYAVVEKQPMRVLKLTVAGDDATAAPTVHVEDAFDAEVVLAGLATDLAGIHYLTSSDELVLLSQESSRLIRTTRDGVVIETLDVAGTQPEGVAFTSDLASFFLAAEPNELLRYDRVV